MRRGPAITITSSLLQVCLLGLAAAGRVRPNPPPAHVSERSHPGHHRRDGNVQPGTARLILGVSRDDSVRRDRKSTRLNSSHTVISYAVFCLKKKKQIMYPIHI